MKIPLKKMLDDWWTFWLDDYWWAAFQIEIAAVQWSDDPAEPYPTPRLKIELHGNRNTVRLRAEEGVIFPRKFPARLREKTIKIINEILDEMGDLDLSKYIEQERKKGTWPPGEETWEWYEVPENEDEDEDEDE